MGDTNNKIDKPTSPLPPANGRSINSVAASRYYIVGQLNIVIMEARNIGNGPVIRPYCIVEFERCEFITKESSGSNPTWDHGASFDVSRNDSSVYVTLWDRGNEGDMETFLGTASVRPTRLENKKQQVWLKLKGRQFKNINGDIHIQFDYKLKRNGPIGMDDFQLLKVIGRGSFGKVLQVRKKDTGRIYAMKILKKDYIVEKDEVKHTLSERNVLAQNDNPFLIQLKFSFQTPEKLYLVLDYVNGGELFFHLQNDSPFSEARARFYTTELLLALQHLHKYGVIYRDLKPENILLDSNGHISLTDFGLVKEDMTDDGRANTFCGTAEYLAPEVLKGNGYGKVVDWWSLGILLYEMLTGIPPFFSENTNIMYKKILFSELTFPSHVSKEARSLLQGLLNRDPEKRLGASAEGAEEIKRHPFFRDTSWEKLMQKATPAPFKPFVKSETDVSNFDPEFTSEDPVDSPPDSAPLSESTQAKFQGFTYQNENEHFRRSRFSPSHIIFEEDN